MSMSDEFEVWWASKGANLMATAPIKTIAWAAYRAATKSRLGIHPVGYQYGYSTHGDGIAWLNNTYHNGCQPIASREIYAVSAKEDSPLEIGDENGA